MYNCSKKGLVLITAIISSGDEQRRNLPPRRIPANGSCYPGNQVGGVNDTNNALEVA